MKYISLVGDMKRELPFYLAMEEYVARYLDTDEAFFMWQVDPTVIFGRNQLIEKEVDLTYCKEHNIKFYRRKSGGGCVYADKGNIMFSYITKEYNVESAYKSYLDKVLSILNQLGIPVESTGRNDIVVEGKKVSGNAFYHVNGKSVVHGTMLFDTDMDNMINAITPNSGKLVSNGVDSVRKRITTLKDYVNFSIDKFKSEIKTRLCDSELILDETAINVIEGIKKFYFTDDFLYGKNPHCNIEKNKRIEGVGDFHVYIENNHGIIKNISVMGDFFLKGDLDTHILSRLKNITYTENVIRKVLKDVNVGDVIMNMNNEQFVNLIII